MFDEVIFISNKTYLFPVASFECLSDRCSEDVKVNWMSWACEGE